MSLRVLLSGMAKEYLYGLTGPAMPSLCASRLLQLSQCSCDAQGFGSAFPRCVSGVRPLVLPATTTVFALPLRDFHPVSQNLAMHRRASFDRPHRHEWKKMYVCMYVCMCIRIEQVANNACL